MRTRSCGKAAGLEDQAASRENVEIVRRWFERLAAGDPAPEFCDPEVEIRNWPGSPQPGPYHGHKGLQRWWAVVNDADVMAGFRLFDVIDTLVVDEDRVVTIQRAIGKAPHSEIDVDFDWASVVRVHEGKVASSFGYPTPAEAKAAVGLSE